METLNLLQEMFLNIFFPHNKLMETKTVIPVFSQGATETHREAWESIKSMLRWYPNHGFDEITQIHIFRNELQQQQSRC